MEIATLMSELSTRFASPGLALNGLGLARILVDEKLHVDFEHDPTSNLLYIYSTVGKLPFEDKMEAYQKLLASNLYCLDTDGATLGVDAHQNEIVVCRVVEPDTTTTHAFIAAVEKLIETALAWTARVDESPKTSESLDSRVMLHQYFRA